jgi:benzoyl-CoA reductase/2-hydroxyglutaryl-CoA dehydratase subunit BcrC/BadD/HgdB
VNPGDELDYLLKARALEMIQKKAKGTKVVGYYPNGYFPEEIALACDVIPIGLCRGGDHEPVDRSAKYVNGAINELCRAQIGYLTGKDDIFYALIDLYISPIVENSQRLIADIVKAFTDIPEFRFEVPREKTKRAYDIYLKALQSLKGRLEELTGQNLSPARLKESVELLNRRRELFKTISLARKTDTPSVSGKDFIHLMQLSYILDIREMLKLLETYAEELKAKEGPRPGPRILLTGLELAWGDDRLIDLIEGAGGQIVVEQYSSTLRDYWHRVETEGDLMENLAARYLMDKTNHAAFVPRHERHDLILNLAKEFRADGLIWYSPLYGDNAGIEFMVFEKKWNDQIALPIMRIDAVYDLQKSGREEALKARVEAFINDIEN